MDDLFTPDHDTDPTIDEDHDYLADLVGENKKFRDVAALAKGKAHADATIEVYKKRLDELTREVNTRKSLEQFMTDMDKRREPSPPAPVLEPDTNAQIDSQTLEAKLEELLSKREASNKAETNRQLVARVLTEQLPNPKQAIQAKAAELGMSPQDLQGLAERNPQVFFKLMDVNDNGPRSVRVAAPQSSVSFETKRPSAFRGASYYENLKRTDPKKYNDPQTVNDMINDAMAIGGLDKFYAN